MEDRRLVLLSTHRLTPTKTTKRGHRSVVTFDIEIRAERWKIEHNVAPVLGSYGWTLSW